MELFQDRVHWRDFVLAVLNFELYDQREREKVKLDLSQCFN
jgi:hypothetical protein